MSLGNIFEDEEVKVDTIQIDSDTLISDSLEECIIHLQTNKIMTPNEIRKLLGLEEIENVSDNKFNG